MLRVVITRVLGRVLAVVLVLTPLAGTTPAQSASTTSIAAASGVRYDSCRDYAYTYTINTTAGWSDWDADITLFDPEGTRTDSDLLYDDANPAAGRGTFFICDFEPAGRWRMSLAVTYYDDSYNQVARGSASGTFVLRLPRTQTSFTANPTRPRKGQVVRFRITSRVERPAGFAPNRYEYVALESLRKGKWSRINGTRSWTNANGVTTVRVRKRSRGAVTVRAVTPGTTDFTSSSSLAKRLR